MKNIYKDQAGQVIIEINCKSFETVLLYIINKIHLNEVTEEEKSKRVKRRKK